MCLIVDANAGGIFLAQPGPIRDWLLGAAGNPRLVAAGALRTELTQISEVSRFLVQLERAGRLRSAPSESLDLEVRRLHRQANCRSNDLHVLALAIVSGARTLATFDGALAADFRSASIISRPRGNVYRNPKIHAHLLRHTPTSCGVRARDKRRRKS
jgi:predicted nucleic acid-binding protein